jgi:hypothetical protein
MRSSMVSEVGTRHVPAVQSDDGARRRRRDRDEGEVEAVCAALVGALVEAVDAMSDRLRSRGERCSSQAVVRPANVSMCHSRRVGLVHKHRALPTPRPRRHTLAAVDVDRDTEGRTRGAEGEGEGRLVRLGRDDGAVGDVPERDWEDGGGVHGLVQLAVAGADEELGRLGRRRWANNSVAGGV